MKTTDILSIMHSPDYFVAVELPRNTTMFHESERSLIEAIAKGVRKQAHDFTIAHLWLLEGTETPQEAASTILNYLVASEGAFLTLERKCERI